MTADSKRTKANPGWKIAIVGLPVFLALSGAFAMWLWWKESQEDAKLDPRLALESTEVRAEDIDENLRKLSGLLGSRGWESPVERKNMRRAYTFVQGILSPQNYGFSPKSGEYVTLEGEIWPTIWADVRGTAAPRRVILVSAPYDQSDAAVAVVLAAAKDLRDDPMEVTVRFVFFPSELYRVDGGQELTDVLQEDERRVALVLPDLPESVASAQKEDLPDGAALRPIAQQLVEKVRALAAEAGKMP